MTDAGLVEAVRREARATTPVNKRAERVAALIRARTGRRWVGIYVGGAEVRTLGWSGLAAPAYPSFPVARFEQFAAAL